MSKPSIWMTCIGAAGNLVTGSGTLLIIEYENKVTKILIDVGIVQGADEARNAFYPVDSSNLDYVMITHAHADHFLALPLLRDFKGKVYATENTFNQGLELLYDAAYNNERKAAEERGISYSFFRDMRKEYDTLMRRKHSPHRVQRYEDLAESIDEIESAALYTMKDVENIARHFCPVPLYRDLRLGNGIFARLIPSTHQNGATSIELYVGDCGNDTVNIVFSGDIGPNDSFLYRTHEYEPNRQINYFVAESLHGVDDKPQTSKQAFEQCEKIILDSIKHNRSVIFTAFALDRSAKIIKTINNIIDKHGISTDIYLDSPLAYKELMHYQHDYASGHSAYFADLGNDPFDVSEINVINRGAQHIKAVQSNEPKIVITASAMGYGGRVLDYFAHDIQRDDVTFVFCGYLMPECPSDILHRAKKGEVIEINGAHYVKHCDTVRLEGFTSHGYFPELVAEIEKFPNLRHLILNHAERSSKDAIAAKLSEMYDFDITAPEMFDSPDHAFYKLTPDTIEELPANEGFVKFADLLKV